MNTQEWPTLLAAMNRARLLSAIARKPCTVHMLASGKYRVTLPGESVPNSIEAGTCNEGFERQVNTWIIDTLETESPWNASELASIDASYPLV
jgi:hypothetical protein